MYTITLISIIFRKKGSIVTSLITKNPVKITFPIWITNFLVCEMRGLTSLISSEFPSNSNNP